MPLSKPSVNYHPLTNMRFLYLALFLFVNCQTTEVPTPKPAPPAVVAPAPSKPKPTVTKAYRGTASYYSIKTNGGTATASGQRLRNDAYTAAHRSLPFGTRVRVTNLKNGKSAVVGINDRGPFIRGRIIDVTIGVARHLGMTSAGVVPCKVEVLRK